MIVYPNSDYDSWISVDDADTYFETRLNSTEWNGEEAALQTAFRSLQELDLDLVFESETNLVLSSAYYTDAEISKIITALKQAQCEQCLFELKNDPDGQAIEGFSLGGLLKVTLPDKKGKQPPRFSQRAIAILRPYIKAATVTRTR